MNDDIGRYVSVIRRSVYYIVLMGMLAVLDMTGWFTWPRGLMEQSVSALYYGVDRVVQVIEMPYRTLTFWRKGTERIASLEQRLNLNVVDYARLKELEDENQALRVVKGIETEGHEQRIVMARIMGRGNRLFVDKGDVDQIRSGMVALDMDGVLVGLVGAVSLHRSEIILPTNSLSTIPVRVVGEKTLGVLTGDGSNVRLGEVLQTDTLEMGGVLVTTGVEGNYPEGLVVGQVTQVTGEVSDVTKGAEVDILAHVDENVLITEGP